MAPIHLNFNFNFNLAYTTITLNNLPYYPMYKLTLESYTNDGEIYLNVSMLGTDVKNSTMYKFTLEFCTLKYRGVCFKKRLVTVGPNSLLFH